MKKRCKKCGSINVKKDWNKRWKQRYKCKDCWYVFQNSSREKGKWEIREEYSIWKQTYEQLGEKYWKSKRTISRELDKTKPKKAEIKPIATVLIIDTTYFGKRWKDSSFWVMNFRSYELKKNLLRKIVEKEEKIKYKEWIEELEKKWWEILAIVSDWRWWMRDLGKPFQLCKFHQIKTVTKYITRHPTTEAWKELREISLLLCKIRKDTVEERLNSWYYRYKDFLNEKNDEWMLIHLRVRNAYLSIKRNLEYLYTFEKYRWKFEIPTTTNSIESTFSHLKEKVWLHRWLKKERKVKLINEFLSK